MNAIIGRQYNTFNILQAAIQLEYSRNLQLYAIK